VLQLASAAASFLFASWLAGHYAAAAAGGGDLAKFIVPVIPLKKLPGGAGSRVLAGMSGSAASLLAGTGQAVCTGFRCYAPTFRVLVVLNLCSLCGVLWLYTSSKVQYEAIVAGRHKDRSQQQERYQERSSLPCTAHHH